MALSLPNSCPDRSQRASRRPCGRPRRKDRCGNGPSRSTSRTQRQSHRFDKPSIVLRNRPNLEARRVANVPALLAVVLARCLAGDANDGLCPTVARADGGPSPQDHGAADGRLPPADDPPSPTSAHPCQPERRGGASAPEQPDRPQHARQHLQRRQRRPRRTRLRRSQHDFNDSASARLRMSTILPREVSSNVPEIGAIANVMMTPMAIFSRARCCRR